MNRLAEIPMLTYDELTCAMSSLADQIRADMEVLYLARSYEVRSLLEARVQTSRSLLTAVTEARYRVERPHGGPLEPLRVVWDQDETHRAAWAGTALPVDPTITGDPDVRTDH